MRGLWHKEVMRRAILALLIFSLAPPAFARKSPPFIAMPRGDATEQAIEILKSGNARCREAEAIRQIKGTLVVMCRDVPTWLIFRVRGYDPAIVTCWFAETELGFSCDLAG